MSNNDIKIVICTTFREFNGSDNDNIQKMFLKSITNQDYNNFILVVTIFNEKFVDKYLADIYKRDIVFKYKPLSGYRYSLNELFLSGIDEGLKYEKAIVVWTTCDVIFPSNFFSLIVANFAPFVSGTSHPHYIYKSTKHYMANAYDKKNFRPNRGIDTVYFDVDIFRDNSVYKAVKEYRNYDWGPMDHFLAAFAKKYARKSINLFFLAPIAKIENDRIASKESEKSMCKSHWSNMKDLKKFLRHKKLSKYFVDLVYCHLTFKLQGSKLAYFRLFYKFYVIYAIKFAIRKIKLSLGL